MANRIWALDAARSAALLAMASYHLTYDLQMFGLIGPGVAVSGFFWAYARAIAGSFLALAGAGLWLAHGRGLRGRAFARRLAMIVAGAAAVSLATALALPDWWVFFGILHCIAASSLLGLAFLRLPGLVNIALGLAVVAAPGLLPVVDHPALIWLGLGSTPPQSVDFEPLLPWFGPFLIGMGLARLAEPALRALPAPRGWLRRLDWPGRHSLAIYLLHQPVLFALVWAFVQIS